MYLKIDARRRTIRTGLIRALERLNIYVYDIQNFQKMFDM